MTQPSASIEATALVRECMELYESPLIAYAATLLHGDVERAREVVQDTFLRLFMAEPDKVRDSAKAWLYTVCRNRAFDVLRKDQRLTFTEDEVLHSYSDHRPDPGASADTHELYDRAWQLLERLTANQQEVIRLKFLHHCSYKDIARVTGLTVGNVGFLMHVGLKKLRGMLTEEPSAPEPRSASAFSTTATAQSKATARAKPTRQASSSASFSPTSSPRQPLLGSLSQTLTSAPAALA